MKPPLAGPAQPAVSAPPPLPMPAGAVAPRPSHAAAALGLQALEDIVCRPHPVERRLPLSLPLVLVLVGLCIWLAENLGTFFGLWAYPHQLGAWAAVHVTKWSAWPLLVLMSFTIVTNLKHIKATVHVPP